MRRPAHFRRRAAAWFAIASLRRRLVIGGAHSRFVQQTKDTIQRVLAILFKFTSDELEERPLVVRYESRQRENLFRHP